MELKVQRCQVELPAELIACHVFLAKTKLLHHGGWQGIPSFNMATDKINCILVVQPVKKKHLIYEYRKHAGTQTQVTGIYVQLTWSGHILYVFPIKFTELKIECLLWILQDVCKLESFILK